MVAILTGNIINSRKGEVPEWLEKLKAVLNHYGPSPQQWEIIEETVFNCQFLQKRLIAAFHIKAVIKQTQHQDVRIAIGIGDETTTISFDENKVIFQNGDYLLGGNLYASNDEKLAFSTPNNIFSRWYGFVSTFPNCEILSE